MYFKLYIVVEELSRLTSEELSNFIKLQRRPSVHLVLTDDTATDTGKQIDIQCIYSW